MECRSLTDAKYILTYMANIWRFLKEARGYEFPPKIETRQICTKVNKNGASVENFPA
jgi:hypothetical protein